MAFRKLVFLFSIFLPIILAKFTWAESGLVSEDATVLQDHNGAVSPSKAAKLELDQLKSKISSLETSIEDQTGEFKRADGGIKELEKVIEKKSISLASLQSAFRSVQENGSLEVKERIGEVNTRVDELQKQLVNLKKDIEAQTKKKDKLEAQANAAEEKIEELNLKLENLLRINDEQKSRICNAQHALEMAEEEMLKAKLEASSIIKQFKEVHQAWLPPWLSAHLVHCQLFVLTYWNELGRPILDLTIQQEWLPTIKEHCKSVMDGFHILAQSLANKAVYYYHVAKSSIEPQIVEMQEFMDLYVQETMMFVNPYTDQVSEIAEHHFEKALYLLKPYSQKVVSYYRKIIENVQIYHSQVQATLHGTFNSYELTKPLATKRLVQIMASILMGLPLLVLFSILAPNLLELFCRKEPKRRRRSTNKSHTRRRGKAGTSRKLN